MITGFHPIRLMRFIATAAFAGTLLAAAVAAQQPGVSPATMTSGTSATTVASAPPPASISQPTKSNERLREGTLLTDVTGTFQSVGADSVTFSPTGGKDAYRLLQNLQLERISRTLDENRGSRPGLVSGQITEFRGANYLLVKKVAFPSQEGDSSAGH